MKAVVSRWNRYLGVVLQLAVLQVILSGCTDGFSALGVTPTSEASSVLEPPGNGDGVLNPEPNPEPNPGSGSSPGVGKAINSIDSVVNDMKDPNDFPPFGRNPGSCQYKGACLIMGNFCSPEAFTPENPYYYAEVAWQSAETIEWLKSFNWTRIMQWGQAYQSEYGHAPGYQGNTRVQIRNLRIYQKRKSTGKWFLIHHSVEPRGAFYTSNFEDPKSYLERIRIEPTGGESVVLPIGERRTYHFWSGPRVASEGEFDPNDIAAIFSTAEARLVLNVEFKDGGVDDRDASRFVLAMGADYYPDQSMNVYPGVGIGRHKGVTKEWQAFNMHTISESELRANPPPLF